ncbi:MAG: right-handed parallel beta-helix repeat-containing protein, partial [Thermoplasmata archaeon]|nr:right-handed parallel beta-helix repeat-containing protein [Thermoplasmata archaeon]
MNAQWKYVPVMNVDATTEGLTMGPEPCRRSALPLIGVLAFLLVLGATLMLSAEDVSARNLLVPDDYATIQQAVDNATAGDEVRIEAGSYNESVKVTIPIKLTSVGEGETVITSDEEHVLRLEGFGITVSFLTIVGSSDNYGIHCSYFSDGLLKDIKVRNCTIGMLLTATYESEIMVATIEDCSVGIMAKNGTYSNHFDGLTLLDNQIGLEVGRTGYPIDDSDNLFTGCVFESNHFGAMIGPNGPENTFSYCGFAYNGGTALTLDGADCLVGNCEFFENDFTGISLTKPGTVTNSTVTYQGYHGIEIVGTSGCTITNVTLDGNLVGVYLSNAQQATLSKL